MISRSAKEGLTPQKQSTRIAFKKSTPVFGMSVPPLRESEAVFYLVPKFYFSLLSFPNSIWERTCPRSSTSQPWLSAGLYRPNLYKTRNRISRESPFPNRIWERENEAVCAFAEYASSVDYSQEAGACIQRFWKE